MSQLPTAEDMLSTAERKAEDAYGYLCVADDWLRHERAAGYPLTPEQARQRDTLNGAISAAKNALHAAIYGGAGHTCHCQWGATGVACSCVMCCDGQAPEVDR